MSTNRRKAAKTTKTSPSNSIQPAPQDQYQAILAWLRRKKFVAALMILCLVVVGIAGLTDSLVKLLDNFRKISPETTLDIGAALYLKERAITRTIQGCRMIDEIRDLTTNCSILRSEIEADDPKISPGTGGATAEIQLRISLTNMSPRMLTNLQLRIAEMPPPFTFSSLKFTPNVRAEMVRLLPSLGTSGPYQITLRELSPNDLAVVTLGAVLTRDNICKVFGVKLDVPFLFIRSDQLPTMENIKLNKLTALELYKQEVKANTGHTGWRDEVPFKALQKGELNRKVDFSFVPPSENCQKMPGLKINLQRGATATNPPTHPLPSSKS